MATERPPFYFLDQSVNLLIVDDDPGIRSLVVDVLKPVRLYNVFEAANAAEAEEHLQSPERIHLCLLDLGLADLGNDEFHLLRNHGARVSFVVFTGSTSPAKGYAARELGAKDIIEKSPAFDRPAFLKRVNRLALLNVINPRYGATKDTLSLSTEVLFDKTPKYVSQWAIQMGITDRELRHIWRKNLGANAKIILSIHQIFTAAFTYYEKLAAAGEGARVRIHNPQVYRRLEEYYHLHRSTITDFIAYGNIAMLLPGT
ncbi:MAG: response regulator [Chitinivibrionales bacterium]|nr:response regulator [Chitinivibrionales bacterium]MBD3396763.1 response regulator [Chitinivibrionales bacterium]